MIGESWALCHTCTNHSLDAFTSLYTPILTQTRASDAQDPYYLKQLDSRTMGAEPYTLRVYAPNIIDSYPLRC